MNWLQGGPYLEISFLHILKEKRTSLVRDLISKLKASFDHFEIAIDSVKYEELVSQFEEGYPYDENDSNTYHIHSVQIPIYLTIEGRRRSILSIEQISDNLIAVGFWFYGDEADVPEWNLIGIKDSQISGFKNFLVELFYAFQFPIGMIEEEFDIKDIFDTDHTFPHESYSLENISEENINAYMTIVVKNGFIDQKSLNVSKKIEGARIIEKQMKQEPKESDVKMPERKSYFLKKIFSESLVVIFSILLALFINEWRNNYNENRKTEVLVKNVKEEIELNQKLVETLIPYHESILNGINEAIMKDSLEETFFKNGFFEIYEVAPKGIIQGKIIKLDWEVALHEKITSRVDYDLAKNLSRLYAQQESVQGTITRILNILSSRETQRKALLQETIIVFGVEINELISQEKDLVIIYNKSLEQIESDKGD